MEKDIDSYFDVNVVTVLSNSICCGCFSKTNLSLITYIISVLIGYGSIHHILNCNIHILYLNFILIKQ